jgi:transcriptional regulator with XRE-family HTH domain
MHVAQEVGQQIKAARQAKRWTQAELATRCGVGKAQISKLERDIRHASMGLLLKLCEVCGLDLRLRPLDDKMRAFDAPAFQTAETFLEQARTILAKQTVYDHVDIFAHTGQLYFLAVRDSKARIQTLRILMRDMRDLTTLRFPEADDAKLCIQQEWQSTLWLWQQLQDTGRITKMGIRYYPFDPMMTFMVIDKQIACFDLLTPQKAFPGATSQHAPTCYIVTESTAVGRQLLSDLSTDFEHLWNDLGVGEETS